MDRLKADIAIADDKLKKFNAYKDENLTAINEYRAANATIYQPGDTDGKTDPVARGYAKTKPGDGAAIDGNTNLLGNAEG
jgi:hypothetical protein